MLASTRTPLRRRCSRTAVVLTAALLLSSAGCSDDSTPTRPDAEPSVESTPLADYDTTDLTLARDEFCDRLPQDTVIAALEEEPTGQDTWKPGTRLPGTKDISNEYGCSWTSGSLTARAWVFAPPITAPRAADFAAETVTGDCQRLVTAATPGAPGVARRCSKGPGLTGLYGLVGDAWVGCEIGGLPASRDDGAARVGEWCVAVLDALRTS